MSLASEVIAEAARAGAWLATVESCTGGLVANHLTDVPGSSSAFWGGLVVYDNSAKRAMTYVSESTLSAHGAVSDAVARELALGGLARMQSALGARAKGPLLCISTTGIAGPSGETPTKPVGLCWIGVAVLKAGASKPAYEVTQAPIRPGASRTENKLHFSTTALEALVAALKKLP